MIYRENKNHFELINSVPFPSNPKEDAVFVSRSLWVILNKNAYLTAIHKLYTLDSYRYLSGWNSELVRIAEL